MRAAHDVAILVLGADEARSQPRIGAQPVDPAPGGPVQERKDRRRPAEAAQTAEIGAWQAVRVSLGRHRGARPQKDTAYTRKKTALLKKTSAVLLHCPR